jgi:hypothetical protein
MAGTQFGSWEYACLEDDTGDHSSGNPVGSLYCSTYSGCPSNHRTGMDEQGTSCASGGRYSICPCQ